MTTTHEPRRPDGPLHTYLPASGQGRTDDGPVSRRQVALLSAEPVLRANIDAPQIADAVTRVTALAGQVFGACPAACEMLLEIALTPGDAELRLFSDGRVPEGHAQRMYDEFAALALPRTRTDPIYVRLHFVVAPAAGPAE